MRHPAKSFFASLAIAVLLAGASAWAAEPPARPGQPDSQAPQDTPDGQAPQAKKDEPPPKTPAEERADLYARLAASKDADETAGIITRLLHSYSESGSDTADLLLKRARQAIGIENYSDALKILDATIALLPDWAEGWNARATARYLDDDYNGLDGRHRADAQARAQAPRRAHGHGGRSSRRATERKTRSRSTSASWTIAPHWRNAQEAADKLKAALAGSEL